MSDAVGWILAVVGFGMGLLFGSFLNVCIVRLPREESILRPRSRCVTCGHAVRWYDNLPLLSYLLLRGRCRDCHARISVQYPLVELLTGVWFAYWSLLAWLLVNPWTEDSMGLVLSCLGSAVLGFLLIGLAVMDWQTMRLPDAFTLSGIFAAMLLVCTQAIFLGPHEGDVLLAKHHIQLRAPGATHDTGNIFLTGPEHLIYGRLAAAVGAFLVLYFIRLIYQLVRKRDGMGLGDAKLLAMIAAFLGFWPAMLALFVGVASASIFAISLLLRGRANGTTRLAFGSFLAAGGLFAAAFGTRVVDWYTSLVQ